VVVLIAGLGGNASYWLAQTAALQTRYQVVSYDQCGTGNNPATLPDGYRIADMAAELLSACNRRALTVFAWLATRWGHWSGYKWRRITRIALARWSGQWLAATE
jgi:pimeloyl-ACP methyl ester carboxylesterase